MKNKIKDMLQRELLHANFVATPGLGVLQHKGKHIDRIVKKVIELLQQ